KPAINIEVITDFCEGKPTKSADQPVPETSKPAINIEVITDFCEGKPRKSADQATTDSKRPSTRSVSACEPYREVIEQALDRDRNSMAIWQDLVTEHGFEQGYQSVKRFVNKIRPSKALEARPVIVTAPGEEAQVDYGSGPMVRDPQTGKYRRT